MVYRGYRAVKEFKLRYHNGAFKWSTGVTGSMVELRNLNSVAIMGPLEGLSGVVQALHSD